MIDPKYDNKSVALTLLITLKLRSIYRICLLLSTGVYLTGVNVYLTRVSGQTLSRQVDYCRKRQNVRTEIRSEKKKKKKHRKTSRREISSPESETVRKGPKSGAPDKIGRYHMYVGESSFLLSESVKNQIVYFVQKVCRFFTSVKCLCL